MRNADLERARILVVDDQEENVTLLSFMLASAGFGDVVGLTDPAELLARFHQLDPDLILLDLHMPRLDGVEVMRRLACEVPDGVYLPVLMLTGDTTSEAKHRVLAAGAKDFVAKPFDETEVLQRIRNLLETRFLHRRLAAHNAALEERVRERTQELEQAEAEILHRLARAAEYRDDKTGQHTQRVARTSARIAEALGLSEDRVELLRLAAPLHDVGKIATPDAILRKPGKLTEAEFEIVKTHTTIGARIFTGSPFSMVQFAREIALAHHERWDGSGYPRGLKGEEIPLPARIVAVADVFDALCYERPYKPARPTDEALAEIEGERGRSFDPLVVEAFMRAQAGARIVRLESQKGLIVSLEQRDADAREAARHGTRTAR